jgi:hypothetical protein
MRIPLLIGSRLAVVNAPDDAVVLAPPPPGEAVADVAAAVRDALRFPLAGEPAETLVEPGGRATLVVEHPSLPLFGATVDARHEALAAASDELERLGVPGERQTLLVAGGLERRARQRDVERLVTPDFARRFRGKVETHDAEDPALVEIGDSGGVPLRVNPKLVETDVVLVVSAAETVLHGGPAALLAAGGAEAIRASGADSLLEVSAAPGWEIGTAFEAALSRHVPLLGVSLALNHPRLRGALRGFPYEPEAVARVSRSPLRGLFRLLPAAARRRVLHTLPFELTASAAYAGPPSVAHAEALLRALEARSVTLDAPLDALCIGVPGTTPHLPRERPNPLLAAYLGLGLALRLWRGAFPLVDGGTAILLNRFHRRFAHGTQQPYRAFFRSVRAGLDAERLAEAERLAARDEHALAAYRSGRSCHPLLPYADWDGCTPAISRLGAVMVAGCRDSAAARQLGFVPTAGLGAALDMARGRAGGEARIGFLLSPPLFPISVGPS